MKNFLWDNIFKPADDELDVIMKCWQKTPLFKNIPAKQITALASNMHIRKYQAGEIVFREGDQGAGAILVLDGQVKIKANDTLLADLHQGDFFGEIALAENDKRTADAHCVKSANLCFFLKQDLEEWIEIEPRLGTIFLMNLASTLAQRLHQANLLLAVK